MTSLTLQINWQFEFGLYVCTTQRYLIRPMLVPVTVRDPLPLMALGARICIATVWPAYGIKCHLTVVAGSWLGWSTDWTFMCALVAACRHAAECVRSE